MLKEKENILKDRGLTEKEFREKVANSDNKKAKLMFDYMIND
jgi:hypothetical protein